MPRAGALTSTSLRSVQARERRWKRQVSCMTEGGRFMRLVQQADGGRCWRWLGSLVHGYGSFHYQGGGSEPAHRTAYRLFVGQIPHGFDLDHLCRTPACVNPAHLEAVTPGVNRSRAMLVRPRRIRCFRVGHLTLGANRDPVGRCLECQRVRQRLGWRRRHGQGLRYRIVTDPRSARAPASGVAA